MFEKKAPFLSYGHLTLGGGKKNIHSLTGGGVAQLSPRRGETQKGAVNRNIYYDISCLAKWITGFYFIYIKLLGISRF